MRAWLTPRRRRGVEILDDPQVSEIVRSRAMSDVARSNRYFGGTRAVTTALRHVAPSLPPVATILDVGTGRGDLVAAMRGALTHTRLIAIGVDVSHLLLRAAGGPLDAAVAGDALRLPVRDRCVDLVLCSQLLHHFETPDALRVIAELHRVSRGWVIVADLGRSWMAAAGFWLAASALRFHPVTRADGVTSVLRGFTGEELQELVRLATGQLPHVRHGRFWRLSATWSVSGASAWT